MIDKKSLSLRIKKFAFSLGFDACGICRAEKVDDIEEVFVKEWLENNNQADMDYLSRNFDKRIDPSLLVEGAKSIISVALNYYPRQIQQESVPQIAYYAYGKDYHDVMKEKLQQLFSFIQGLILDTKGRCFCDTAPVMERYWAAKAGIGFIGKNTLLIIPNKGSYFFLGEVFIDQELEYDNPINISCGSCTRCLDNCPTKALEKDYLLNANKCISYQTIENRGEIAKEIQKSLKNRFYGCDICQQVCPWNKFAEPHSTPEFNPNPHLFSLDQACIEQLTVEEYQQIFKGSAMKRAKYSGLMRNIKALKEKS